MKRKTSIERNLIRGDVFSICIWFKCGEILERVLIIKNGYGERKENYSQRKRSNI